MAWKELRAKFLPLRVEKSWLSPLAWCERKEEKKTPEERGGRNDRVYVAIEKKFPKTREKENEEKGWNAGCVHLRGIVCCVDVRTRAVSVGRNVC